MGVAEEFFDSTIERDFFYLICGQQIGFGEFREVFEYLPNPKLVVKFEIGAGSFSNVTEWNTWKDAKELGPDTMKWLAPCRIISGCGIVLVQERTKPAKTYPNKLPVWMTDTKRSNFGMIGRRFVCHDYANNLICNSGMSKRLGKVEWWDG